MVSVDGTLELLISTTPSWGCGGGVVQVDHTATGGVADVPLWSVRWREEVCPMTPARVGLTNGNNRLGAGVGVRQGRLGVA